MNDLVLVYVMFLLALLIITLTILVGSIPLLFRRKRRRRCRMKIKNIGKALNSMIENDDEEEFDLIMRKFILEEEEWKYPNRDKTIKTQGQ